MPQSGMTYRAGTYECDRNNVLHIGSVFNWLQDALDGYSQRHKIGYDYCRKNEITYVLRGYDVIVDSFPKRMDTVSISTDLVNTTSCSLFFKQTLINTHTRQALLSSISHIVLIDLKNKRPLRLEENIPLRALKLSPMSVEPLSLPSLDVIHAEDTQKVTYDYIDFNQHMNNTNYIVFAERTLNPDIQKKENLRRIQVTYKQAAVLGDKVKVSTKITPNFTDHQISSASDINKQFARIRFFWQQHTR